VDAGRFNINGTTGAVTFRTAPNFEVPTDTGADNVYNIAVTATEEGNPLVTSHAVAVTVTAYFTVVQNQKKRYSRYAAPDFSLLTFCTAKCNHRKYYPGWLPGSGNERPGHH
jgi:hypothetical protein